MVRLLLIVKSSGIKTARSSSCGEMIMNLGGITENIAKRKYYGIVRFLERTKHLKWLAIE